MIVRVLTVHPHWHRSVADYVAVIGPREFAAVPRAGETLEMPGANGRVREVVWSADGTPSIYVESSAP